MISDLMTELWMPQTGLQPQERPPGRGRDTEGTSGHGEWGEATEDEESTTAAQEHRAGASGPPRHEPGPLPCCVASGKSQGLSCPLVPSPEKRGSSEWKLAGLFERTFQSAQHNSQHLKLAISLVLLIATPLTSDWDTRRWAYTDDLENWLRTG